MISTNKENYSLRLEKLLSSLDDAKPSLLLQACCAPCSSYVLEYLARYFRITLYFCNPNIAPASEYTARLEELIRYTRDAGYADILVMSPDYDPAQFYDAVRGMEDLPEGDARCRVCYALRLRQTAEAARDGGYDYFCSTLSISPYKNAVWLNDIGQSLEAETGVRWLPSDFKKKGGYQRSIALSKEYGLYRQDYCGCIYSKRDAEARRAERG